MKCIHCGKVLPDNAIKCYSCGQRTGRNTNQQQPQQTGNNRKTNTQYGQVIKCPACGGMINPFQTQCVCGYVFRGTSTSTAVSDLAQDLQDIDTKSGGNPYASQLNGGIDVFEQQKIALITNFSIPNLKEELVEFVLLTRVHLAKIYADKKRPKNDLLYNAWKTKFEEAHIKAKMMLTSSDLALFSSIESEIQSYENKLQIKKSKIRTISLVGIVASSIQLLASISIGIVSCIILSILELGVFIFTFLLATKVIKIQSKAIRVVSLIIGIILFFANVGILSTRGIKDMVNSEENVETIVWENLEIGEAIPQFNKTQGEIIIDTDTSLSICFYEIEKEEFYEYMLLCEIWEYKIDAIKTESTFTAWKEGNYKLSLWYSDFYKRLSIDLDLFIMKEIKIINEKLLKQIPNLPSTYGKINYDEEKRFSVILGNITYDEFKSFIKQCYDKGYKDNMSNGEKRFYAVKDVFIGKDYELTITYEGNDIIVITLEEIVKE